MSDTDIICPSCGYSNPEDNRFCEKCGSAIVDGQTFPSADADLDGGKDFSGEDAPPGVGIAEESGEGPHDHGSVRKQTIWVWLIGATAILFTFLCVVFSGVQALKVIGGHDAPEVDSVKPETTRGNPLSFDPTSTPLQENKPKVIHPTAEPTFTHTPSATPTPSSTPTPQPTHTHTSTPTHTVTPQPIGGGVDLNGYCQSIGFSGVALVEDNAYGWRCRDAQNNFYNIDMWSVCEWQYGGGRPTYGDFEDSYSWTCEF